MALMDTNRHCNPYLKRGTVVDIEKDLSRSKV